MKRTPEKDESSSFSKNHPGKLLSIIEGQKDMKYNSHETETHIVNTIMNDSIDVRSHNGENISNLRFESLSEELRKFKIAYEDTTDEISTMRSSIDDLYHQAGLFKGLKEELMSLKSSNTQIKNSIDQSTSYYFILISNV